MADQRIDQLNAETTPAAVDVLPIYSVAGSDTKKITVKNLIQVGATLIDNGSIPASKVNLSALNIVNANIDANAEISVSKLADGTARQLLQTDAAGTGVEWASNIDIPGTLDVTSAATFDSNVTVAGALTKSGSNVVTVGDSGTVTSAMLLNGTILDADINASAEIAVSKLADGLARQLLQTDAAATGVEWASNIDIPGTLDVTSAATFDSTVAVTGALTRNGSNVVTVGDSGTVTSAMLLNGTIVDADISPSAEIAVSKLADGTSGNIVLGNSANVATSTAVTGDVTIGNTGATAIAAGVIVDADVNASAAIAYSKLAALTSGNIVLGSSASVATSTPITGDVTISSTGVTAIAAGVIVNADINASAAIVDTKLATIATAGKVSNSATTATDANNPSSIVARNPSGNFTAGTITAALTGTASGNLVAGGALGTPASGTLTSCTGLPISTGVSGLGTGAATFLATPSSANLAALLTDETGTGAAVFATSPTLVSPVLGTPASGVLTNCTNLPIATVSVAGAMLPGTGLSVTGGGAVNHTNSVTAGTTSGVTFDAQGHITATTALVGGDLPVATSGVKGAVRPGTGLTVDGSGILDISAATNIALGGVIAGSDFGISTGTISLATQGGLTAGTYTKATFNSKGIATGGTALVAGDIPNLAASQITSGSLDIARIATNTVTSAKLANYAVTKIGDTQPTADHIGEFFFNPLSRDLFLWDGNVYQPIGISVGEIVFAGTFDASLGSGTGLISSVTPEGTAIGLAIGQTLPAPAAGNSRYYFVVAEGCTITTGNAPHVVLAPPDILLSNGITWTEVDVSQTITAQTANNISFTPAGSIVSVNVQTAIQELDGDKLPIAGGTITGNLEIGAAGSLSFEGSTTNDFETFIAVVDPTADRTITLPNITGTVVTTGDTGTVTSTMLLNGTILDADINASAAIVDTKLATIATALKVSNSATTATNANTASTIVARDASGNFTAGTITAALAGTASNVTTNANLTGHVTSVGNAAVLGSFTSAQLLAALTDETGTGAAVFATSPTFVTPALGTPSSGTLTNCTFPTLNQNTTGNAATVTTNANLTGDVTSVGNATTIAAGVIVDADINASAGIVDTKLATISTAGKVSNSATTATHANTLSAIVARDPSGNFTAGTITAALTGAASSNVLKAGDTMTGVLAVTAGTAALPAITPSGDLNTGFWFPAADTIAASTAGSEVARLDSSGRLLVGTSSARSTYLAAAVGAGINVEAAGNLGANNRSISIVNGYSLSVDGDPIIYLGRTRSDTIGGTTVVQSDDYIGRIAFVGSDGTNMLAAAQIRAQVDGTPGTNDMPGRLVFSTTADGASSPTERMRVDSAGTTTLTSATSTAPFIAKISSTEVARLDSSGRLLVGTSTARANFFNGANTAQIQLEGTNFQSAAFAIVCNANSDDKGSLILAKNRGTTVGSNTIVQDGDDLGSIEFQGSDGAEFVQAAAIKAEVDGTPGANDMPGRLVFSTTADGAASPTERLRIGQSGYMKLSNNGSYLGTAATYHEIIGNGGSGSLALTVANTSATGNGVQINSNSDGTSYAYLIGYSTSAAANRIIIWSNGNVVNTNNSYGAISDIKLKENIVDANSQWDDLKALQVRNYNFKEGQTHTQIGLVAQEVELVSPGLVTESPDRDEDGNDLGTVTKSVNYSVLYMKAVKALQEAMERIEILEAAVTALQQS